MLALCVLSGIPPVANIAAGALELTTWGGRLPWRASQTNPHMECGPRGRETDGEDFYPVLHATALGRDDVRSHEKCEYSYPAVCNLPDCSVSS